MDFKELASNLLPFFWVVGVFKEEFGGPAPLAIFFALAVAY
jgi:hypothetical protein